MATFNTPPTVASGQTVKSADINTIGQNTQALKDTADGLATTVSGKANSASPTFTGTVTGVSAAAVGLGNVNNTADADKPVSTAAQTALNGKQNTGNYIQGTLLAAGTTAGTVPGGTPVGIVAIRQA